MPWASTPFWCLGYSMMKRSSDATVKVPSLDWNISRLRPVVVTPFLASRTLTPWARAVGCVSRPSTAQSRPGPLLQMTGTGANASSDNKRDHGPTRSYGPSKPNNQRAQTYALETRHEQWRCVQISSLQDTHWTLNTNKNQPRSGTLRQN